MTAPGVIRSETNLVLVDVVALDKKDNYVRDLDQKDFHVFEDDQEQTITTFSRSSDPGTPQGPAQLGTLPGVAAEREASSSSTRSQQIVLEPIAPAPPPYARAPAAPKSKP